MKVLVTGATSGLGRNAVEYLRRQASKCATGRNQAMGGLLEKWARSSFMPISPI